MNGIHLETYVLGGQIAAGSAPVALHCEGGCPFQAEFIRRFTAKARGVIEGWGAGYTVFGPAGRYNVCQVEVPLGATPGAMADSLATELRRLQTLAPLIDET